MEMDWKQIERRGDVLGTGKDRIDDGLEHRKGVEMDWELNRVAMSWQVIAGKTGG